MHKYRFTFIVLFVAIVLYVRECVRACLNQCVFIIQHLPIVSVCLCVRILRLSIYLNCDCICIWFIWNDLINQKWILLGDVTQFTSNNSFHCLVFSVHSYCPAKCRILHRISFHHVWDAKFFLVKRNQANPYTRNTEMTKLQFFEFSKSPREQHFVCWQQLSQFTE